MTGIVGRWYMENGKPVQILIQWGLKSKGESYGGPRNVMIYRKHDRTKVVRPFRGLRLPDPATFLLVQHRVMGWPIMLDAQRNWIYQDTLQRVAVRRSCVACDQMQPLTGHDPCIANLPGVHAACCGHGLPYGNQSAYVMFQHPTHANKGTFRGSLKREEAIAYFAEQGRTVPEELDAAALQRVRDAFPGLVK